MVVDVGTGTGQAVLRRARRDPEALVIGVDAEAGALAEPSRRAARSERRGGLPNAIFLAAAADGLPGALAGRADLVTVALPWGSLLHGLLAPDPDLLAAIAACLKPGGQIELLLSTLEADGASTDLTGEGSARWLADAYSALGLAVIEVRPATAADVERLSSGWGRRLGIPDRRVARLYRLGTQAGRGASVGPTKLLPHLLEIPAHEIRQFDTNPVALPLARGNHHARRLRRRR